MMQFLVRLLISAASLWVAVKFVPGIHYEGELTGILGVALVFGLVNAFIRPALAMLTCPLVVLTLGLFIFVLNGLMLWLTSVIASAVGLNFHVDGLVPAVIGAIIVGLVSTVLNLLVGERKERS